MTRPNSLDKLPLDQFAPKIQAAMEARREAKELLALAETIEAEIKAFIGDRNVEATLFGVPVYTYQEKDAYAWRKFQDAHPHIAERFTREVTVRELDKNAVKEQFGDLLKEFQTREFRHVNRNAA
jgi:hypothetical protein